MARRARAEPGPRDRPEATAAGGRVPPGPTDAGKAERDRVGGVRAAAHAIRRRVRSLPLTRAERTLVFFVLGTGLAGTLLLAIRAATTPRFQPFLVQGTPGTRAPSDLSAARLSQGGAELPMDVNAATALQLQLLPGVGKKTAYRIVEERSRGGPFRTTDDLARVEGITPRRLARLRPYVTVRAGPKSPVPRPPEPTAQPPTADD